MAEYLSQEEITERERAMDVFLASVSLAETQGQQQVTIAISDAILIRDEIERLNDIEQAFDDACSAAEDRRWL